MWWGIFARLIFFGGGLGSGRLAFGLMRMPITCDLDQKLDRCHWYELLFFRLVLWEQWFLPFLFGRDVDLGGRNLVRFMPLDGSVLISMLSCAPEVVGFGCLVGLFWKRYWFRVFEHCESCKSIAALDLVSWMWMFCWILGCQVYSIGFWPGVTQKQHISWVCLSAFY